MRQVLGGMAVGMAFGLYAVALVNTAWVCDDAYISYRTVDNVLHGFGLTWNVDERVQAFSNPLWVLLNAAAALGNRVPWHIVLSGLALSFGVSLLAVGMLALGVARGAAAGVFALITLTFSRAFVDFSTSGLENPMNHLLLAIFAWLMLRERWTMRVLFGLSLCCGLSMTNRMDTVLLYAPVLAYAWLAERSLRATLALAAGFAPFIAWEVFAEVYYGFPFPNTAYAKLGTGIPAMELTRQGLWYLWHTVAEDRATAAAVALGLLGAPLLLRRGKWIALALGGLLYIVYVVKVGGDFMGGRFLSAPLMVAMLLLVQVPLRGAMGWGLAAVGAILLCMSTPYAPLFAGNEYGSEVVRWDAHRVADERWYFMPTSGLKLWDQESPYPIHRWAEDARRVRGRNAYASRKLGACGFFGYFAGPKLHGVDYFALVDPLVARLPALHDPAWRIGHFVRFVPKWYLDLHAQAAVAREKMNRREAMDWLTLYEDGLVAAPNEGSPSTTESGRRDAESDPDLMRYYAVLSRIIHGPIWSWDRFRAIYDMNFGRYEYLINRDLYRYPKLDVYAAAQLAPQLNPEGEPAASRAISIPMSGIETRLGTVAHNARVEFSADRGEHYRLVFLRGEEELAHCEVIPSPQPGEGLVRIESAVPEAAVRAGYDAIRFVAYHGGRRAFGYLRLL